MRYFFIPFIDLYHCLCKQVDKDSVSLTGILILLALYCSEASFDICLDVSTVQRKNPVVFHNVEDVGSYFLFEI